MWQRFTEEARWVILQATKEAEKADSLAVDTEHLLLGLFVQNEDRITRLLTAMGVNASVVRAEATDAVDRVPKRSADEQPKLTASAKNVLGVSGGESRRANHTAIAPEHMFLALLGESQGQASQILRAQGADAEKAQIAVAEAIARQAPHWAIPLRKVSDEQLLLSLLERREDLLVEILGLDVLALKKARLKLLVGLNLQEEAALLREDIENGHS